MEKPVTEAMRRIVLSLGLFVAACSLALAQPHCEDCGGGPPPQLPAPVVLTNTIFCMAPTLQITAVTGATQYEMFVDGSPVTSFPVDGLATKRRLYNFMPAAGETHVYQYRALMAGQWTGLSYARVFYLDCMLFPILGQGQVLTSLFKFPDVTDEPVTLSAATTLVYTSLRNLIETYSYGQATIAGPAAVGYFMMPHPITYYCPLGPNDQGNWYGCNPHIVQMQIDADAVLTAAGYNLSLYNTGFNPHVFSHIQFSGGEVFSTDPFSFNLYVLIHEYGHDTAYLQHAFRWDCPSGADVGPNLLVATDGGCYQGGYDAPGEPMGNGGATQDFSAVNKKAEKWIPSNEWIDAASCGVQTYTLKALSGTVATREIRVAIPDFPYWFYSLEYRPATGVRVWFHPSAPFLINVNGWADANMYQVNHAVNGNADITPSNPFVDPYRGVTVEVLSMGAQEASVRVTRPPCP